MAFVLDASVTLAWHFKDEETAFSRAIFERTIEETVVVPAHWWLEVANGILMGERRKRATPDQAAPLVELLQALSIETDFIPGEHAFDRILPLARAHRLTVYDAIYLEVAERRGLGLATLDGALETAARSAGVSTMARLGSE